MAKTKHQGGRPGKLTPAILEKICLAIRAGSFPANAARWAGVSPRTYYRWMRLGREADEGRFWQFWQSIAQAEATAEFNLVTIINQAEATDAKYAAWFLERRFRKRWGRRANVQDFEDSAEAEFVVAGKNSPKPTPEELAKTLRDSADELDGGVGRTK